MGEHNRSLGQGVEFEWDGETWILSPWSYEIQGKFERYLEQEAVKAVHRMASLLPKEEYDYLLKKVIQDITSGVYSFGSEVVREAFNSTNHLTHLLWLSLEVNHKGLKKEKVQGMLAEIPDVIIQKMEEANAQVNPPRQEKKDKK